MRKRQTTTVNRTFSLPLDVSEELHIYIKHRDMSRFVSEAIRKELKSKKEELRQAYLMSNKDAGQKEAMQEWKETLADGSDEW